MSDPRVSYHFESLPLNASEDIVGSDLDERAELGIDDDDTDYRIRVYQHGARGR